MSIRKWILGAILVAGIASAFKPDGSTPAQPSAPAPPPVKPMAPHEREVLIKRATSGLHVTRDKIEKTSFFSANKSTKPRTTVAAYLAIGDTGPVHLRAVADYSGRRWIFVKAIKVMADDEIVLEREVKRADIRRDNGSDWVIENFDIPADLQTFIALQTIAASKSATVRYIGKDRYHDHHVTEQERTNLRRVLDAYAASGGLR